MDSAGQNGGRVQLHQEGQEDVRKAPFYGQIAPIWPVSVVFSAASAYQSTGMGVVSVGEGQGTRKRAIRHFGKIASIRFPDLNIENRMLTCNNQN